MLSPKEYQVSGNRRINVFLQKIIFSKHISYITHKENIDTKTYFISRLLTLADLNNVVAMATCPIISTNFSLKTFPRSFIEQLSLLRLLMARFDNK